MARTKSTSVKPVARTKRTPVKVAKVVSDNLLSQTPTVPIQTVPLMSESVSDNLAQAPNTTIEINGDVDTLNTPYPIEKQSHTGRSGRGFVIGLVGGSVVGYLSYNSIKTVFLDKGYDQNKANQYAMISAGVCALVTFWMLYKIIK